MQDESAQSTVPKSKNAQKKKKKKRQNHSGMSK